MHCEFVFPLISKEILADEWLRINRARPVLKLLQQNVNMAEEIHHHFESKQMG